MTMTLKSQTRDSNTHIAQYLENGWIYTLRSKGPPIGNDIWTIKWSRDRWRNVTPEGAVRQYVRLASSDSLASCVTFLPCFAPISCVDRLQNFLRTFSVIKLRHSTTMWSKVKTALS